MCSPASPTRCAQTLHSFQRDCQNHSFHTGSILAATSLITCCISQLLGAIFQGKWTWGQKLHFLCLPRNLAWDQPQLLSWKTQQKEERNRLQRAPPCFKKDRNEKNMRMKLVYLLNDCVIDVKVAEVINSNKISNPQTERRPFCCVAEHLRVFLFSSRCKFPINYWAGWLYLMLWIPLVQFERNLNPTVSYVPVTTINVFPWRRHLPNKYSPRFNFYHWLWF